ncbi:MAG: ATPase, T2SS/T4P/T4SS family [Candidatus Diapherotrites archaeon]
MKISGFEVGPYAVKEEGGKRHLVFDCRDCVYGSSIADDQHCRYHVLRVLQEVEASLVVLAEVYERVYDERQAKMLAEIAAAAQKFEVESIWSYAHLGDPQIESEALFGERHDILAKISHELLMFDPVAAYIALLGEVKKEKEKSESMKGSGKYSDIYLNTLLYIRQQLEGTELMQMTKNMLLKLKQVPETIQLYRTFFEAQVKPSFIGARLLFEEMETLELLDEYSVKDSSVQIFKHPNKPEKLYFINPPEYTMPPEKYFILSKTKEVVASYRPGRTSLSTLAKSRKYFERVYQSTIKDLCRQNNIHLENEEIIELSQIVARYTVGYGILEVLLSDRKLTDIYVDSPIGLKPLYVVHSDFGQCQTNVIYTQDEADALVSKMRASSGRPFDEAHPVLDLDLADLDTRVAVIGPPLAIDGTAFAFRLHKVTPWTLPQFIDAKMLPPLAAGLLSFFIDAQATMLVTGSRGSGKTSLMQSLMLEIVQSARIIVQEDSVTGDAEILVEQNGKMQRTTVGELIDSVIEENGCVNLDGREIVITENNSLKVFAMDTEGKISLSNASQLMRHKVNKELYEFTTRSGKKIKVTKDHCLFGLKGNEIMPIRSEEITEGTFIATPRLIPFEDRAGLDKINIFEHAGTAEAGFVAGGEIEKLIERNWLQVKQFGLKNSYNKTTIQAWKRNKVLPAKIFRDTKDCLVDFSKVLYKDCKDSKAIPAEITLNKDFLNFMGLWLADGCYDGKYGVIISSPDCRETVSGVARQFGLRERKHSDGFSYIISNTALVSALKNIIGLNGDSHTKKFPKWVYNLSRKQIAYVLEGLFSGDGYSSKYEVGISLVSKEMTKDIQLLLPLFGINTRTKFAKKGRIFITRISGIKMLRSFKESIGFLQEHKRRKLNEMCEREPFHDISDVIPFSAEAKKELASAVVGFNRHDYVSKDYALGRQKLQKYVNKMEFGSCDFLEKIKKIAESDIYWDEIKEVKCLGKTTEYVYDFSVPGKENFVCENIIAHNTLEIPVSYMKNIGFNIQRLKTRSPIGVSMTESEVAPEEALRTALRLGDSALIIGEVRSTEARVLYEAMRIGAAGNIVMGTIHGDSAYSVWDRIVNDLDVPNTSFKATDVVVVARPIRFEGSLNRQRRVVQVTEIKKEWQNDPLAEGGMLDLMSYDARKDSLDLLEDNLKESDLFSRISKMSGLTMGEMWESIKMNASSKAFLVELKQKNKLPEILEAENVVVANNKLMMLKQDYLDEHGEIDYSAVLGKWKNWAKNYLAKRLLARKKA